MPMKSRKTKRFIFWTTIFLAALIIPLQFADEVQAAHTFDTKLRFTGATSPLTQSYTCGSGATLLVLGIVTAGNTPRTGGAPTYNGAVMTQVDSTRIATETNVEMWYLANPSTGSAYTISVPNTNTRTLYVTASSYKAASGKTSALDTSNGDKQTSSNPYVCITTTADGDVIVDILGDGYDDVPTANDSSGQYTVLYSTDDGNYSDNAQYRLQPAAGMDCPDWTTAGSDEWAMVVGAFKEVVPIYYSVGTESNPLYGPGQYASASNGVLTLDDPADDNIGVGDEITHGSNKYYIRGRTSSTVFNIQTATGGTNITFGPPSEEITIKRAFSSLSAAESGSANSDHLNTLNLVTGGYQLNWACYADGKDTTGVSINDWTTGANNFIRVYTPTSTSEVGISQRHNGTWKDGVLNGYMLESGTDYGITVRDNHVRIEGLVVRPVAGKSSIYIWDNVGYSVDSDIRISHCLLVGRGAANQTNGLEVKDNASPQHANLTVFNTIAYSHGSGNGFHMNYCGTANFYNCTSYNSSVAGSVGFYGVATCPTMLKNCISMGNGYSDYYCASGCNFDADSGYNMDSDNSAPGDYCKKGRTAANQFVSITAGSENLHLKDGSDAILAGTSLSGTFTDDIDGETRYEPWDMGADAYPGYRYRRSITLDKTKRGSTCGTSSLPNFPVLISLSGDWLKTVPATNGRIYNSNGYDIAFRDSSGKISLNYEIEKYDGANGALLAWVKVNPLFDGDNDTTIYIYYGNPNINSAPAASVAQGVWDTDFRAVYHLKETSGNHHIDSTSNTNLSTTETVATQGSATGKIDGADGFVATSSNQVVIPDKDILDITSAISIEAWVYPQCTTDGGCVTWDKYRIVTKNNAYVLRIDNTQNLHGYIFKSSSLVAAKGSGTANYITTSGYQYVAMTWDGSGTNPVKLYRNGSEVTSYSTQQSTASPMDTSTSDLYIASHGTGEYFGGLIDEVRISSKLRDACWIGTCYNNQNDPSTFIKTSGIEESPAPTAIKLSSFSAWGESRTVTNQSIIV
jgi:hypothetical protein